MSFSNPSYLWLLMIIPIIVIWYIISQKKKATFLFPSNRLVKDFTSTWKIKLRFLPFILRLFTMLFIIIAMARPQTIYDWSNKSKEGIDIMIVMDVSTSMLTTDLSPNRIDAAKKVAYDFINNRQNDEIGLTLFAGEAFLQCPLTIDHDMLLRLFERASCDLQKEGVIGEGTAIGMGISSALFHLENSHSKSKVIILLTDGENNTGEISPSTAAKLAKTMGIRIYTILLGKENMVKSAITPLEQIANETGGMFYQAGTNQKLEEIYNNIDSLEKTKLQRKMPEKRHEAFQLFVLMALFCFVLEMILRITIRQNP